MKYLYIKKNKIENKKSEIIYIFNKIFFYQLFNHNYCNCNDLNKNSLKVITLK